MCIIFQPFSMRKLYSDIHETKDKLYNDNSYSAMLLRRRFSKRVFIVSIVFAISFYLSTLIFGSFHTPKIFRLTELSRCPACYGISVCPELYSGQITHDYSFFSSLLNAKNIYHGHTSTTKVILKKLAHDSELKEFDDNLCKAWNLKRDCKPTELLNISNTVIKNKIKQLVAYNWTHPPTEPRKGLVFCPYEDGVIEFLKYYEKPLKSYGKSSMDTADLINYWTMLSLNPEPIVLQNLGKSKGWPVPKYGGVCGRIELVSDEGVLLSSLPLNILEWHRKLYFAKQILDAAMDFTFKHERYRFYLMDWSLDNIVVNERDQITFVDLEDVIVLDKQIQPNEYLPKWYQRYLRGFYKENSFTFSIQKNCVHHISDHNLYAACYILAGPDSQLLHPIPDNYQHDIQLVNLFIDCLKGTTDRFHTVSVLQGHIETQLRKVTVAGFGAGELQVQRLRI